MRNNAEYKKSQSGQILIYTTIIVMLAALILVPLMEFAFTSHRSAQIRKERTLELYASDAGIEDALYQIKTEKKGTDLANLGFGEDSSYDVGAPDMNDRDVNVSVQKVWLPEDLPGNLKTDAPVDSTTPSLDTDKSDKLVVVGMLNTVQAMAASDDFNSGGWSGGNGSWAGSWTQTGNATVNSTEGCNGNSLKLADVPSTATRTANLLKYMKPQLKFSARASSLEPGDTVDLKVKYDNGEEKIVETWAHGNETSGCNSFNINLYNLYGWSGNDTSVPLQITFDGNLSSYLIASHDFEPPNNAWSGGYVWATNWTRSGGSGNPTGETAILTGNDGNGNPIQGTYYLRLRSNDGYAQRRLNLSGYTNPHLQFWAKATSFESSENAQFLTRVGNSGSFTSRLTWRDGVSYPSWPAEQKDDNVYHYFDVDLSQFGGGGQSNFWIAFDANMGSTTDYFYVDDIRVVEGDSFYVDNLWVGDEYNSNTIEIAYTDATLGGDGNAFLDRVGVWMPPGCHYVGVVGNETTVELYKEPPTTILSDTYAGGTIVEWDFASPGVALHQPPVVMPKVKTLTFAYKMDVAQTVEGMFTWIKAHGGSDQTYISWDKGYEVYKAVSQAYSQILGSNTQVTAYVSQGEVNKRNAASYGNYVAIGNTLLKDNNGDDDHVRESTNTPSYFTISSIPNDAEVKAAWLYWSAFQRIEAADTLIDFMYPKEYTNETFEIYSGNGVDAHTIAAYTERSEPLVTLPREMVVDLSPKRYCAEALGNASIGDGNNTFFTDYKPVLEAPDVKVRINSNLINKGVDYVINYASGNVTIIKDTLAGPVTIDYSIAGSSRLTGGVDYTLNLVTSQVAIINDCLAGNVTIDYWASHWSHNDPVQVTHAAYDRYGTSLPEVLYDNDGQGWSYVCFRDVTDIVKGTGNGKYGVDGVDAIPGDEHQHYYHNQSWPEWCYSGWSLVIIYDSPQETAHQFYLYDPIHNNGVCPFYSEMNTEIPFTLTDFYPPEGLASGRLTYFVGEGDVNYDGDSIKFKGGSQPPSQFVYLFGPYNPVGNIMNNQSSNGEQGVDIDTFDVTHSVGADTTANIVFETDTDSWNLVYIVLSFKTNMVPKPDYSFNVASVTYQYELGN